MNISSNQKEVSVDRSHLVDPVCIDGSSVGHRNLIEDVLLVAFRVLLQVPGEKFI